MPPHIAAGINLNLPVIGTMLRSGGAFFMRRSFRGNALYSAVFTEYVAQLVAGGYSIEYFIEGGRSRTGRLLQPKGGMVAMTVRALPAPAHAAGAVPAGVHRLREADGRQQLPRRADRQAEGEGIDLAAADGHPQGAAQQLRPGGGELRRADPPQRRAGRTRAGLGRRAAGRRGKARAGCRDTVDALARTHPGQHQPRRRRQSDQPARDGAAVHAQARDGRSRPARADRAVARRCCADAAVFGPRHGHAAHAGADHRPRRGDQRAHAHRASARRRARRRAATPRCC